MERLQEALAKAREQRQQGGEANVGRPRGTSAPARSPSPSVDEAWAALTPVKMNRSILKRHRIVAANGGRDAAPYDLLRTKIIHQAHINNWRRVAIVSPESGSGKTTTLANLCFSFERQRDMRLLVIDFDLRRPMLDKVLGQKCQNTMADVIEGRVGFAEHGLRLGERIGIGLNCDPAYNPSEMLLSRQARDALDRIEKVYEPGLSLFDVPPLNASDDNIAFLQNVDCAVIIAAAEATPISRLDQAERQVAELTNVMGVVLNKCRYVSASDGYDYY